MKKSFKQRISFLLAIMLVITLLVGCGTSASPEEPAELAMATPQSLTSITPLQGASPPAAIRDIFPDGALAGAVALELGETVDSIVTQADLDQIEEFNISHLGIESLEGIQYLHELRRLCAWDNQISDLSPLSGFSYPLSFLNLGRNLISDLNPLSGPIGSSLATMVLVQNQISDVTPLAYSFGFPAVYLCDNQIRDIGPILGRLQIRAERNQITDFTGASILGTLGAVFSVYGRDQRVTLEPMLRTELVSIANMLHFGFGHLRTPSYISDGGVYANGMITWSGLTTQRYVSFSWGNPSSTLPSPSPLCNFCCASVNGALPRVNETSGIVTIPLQRPQSPEIIELNRDSIFEFPSRAVGATPSQLITTVRNISNTSPGPLTVRLSGADASSFEFRYISCNNLRPHPDHKPVFRDLPNATSFTIPNLEPGEAIEFIMRPRLNLPAGRHTATVTVSGGGGIWETFDVVFEVR